MWRKRMVRLHLVDPYPSVDGIYAGRVQGHYRILKPELKEASDRTSQLEGELWVPAERVVFMQVTG